MLTSTPRRRLIPTLIATAALSLGATGLAGAAVPAAAPTNPAPRVSIPAPWETQAVLPRVRLAPDVITYLATH